MIIYCTKNAVNGKIYVCQDRYNNDKYLGAGKLLRKAIAKYGAENFVKTVIDTCQTLEELNQKEQYWISKLNARDRNIGYNLASGGSGGDTYSTRDDKHLIASKRLETIRKNPEKFRQGYVKRSENYASNPEKLSAMRVKSAQTKKCNPEKWRQTVAKRRLTVHRNPEPSRKGYAKMQETKRLNPRTSEQLLLTSKKHSDNKSHYFVIHSQYYKGLVRTAAQLNLPVALLRAKVNDSCNDDYQRCSKEDYRKAISKSC